MILEALKDRDNILQNRSTLMKPNSSWLQRGLSARDKSGRTPLDVAQHYFRIQDSERDAVARWDEIAGGVADWGKCTTLLESAAAATKGRTKASQNESASGNKQSGNRSWSSQSIPGLPLHLRRGVMACLDCSPMSGGTGTVCMTTNWQASFQQALGNSAMQCIVASSPAAVESKIVTSASCLSRDTSSAGTTKNTVTTAEISNKKNGTAQSICKRCMKPTIAFYQLPGVGILVCKNCKRSAK